MGANNKKAGANATVIGASLAGLLAARALADYYERVTILERDSLPDGTDCRRGVPQAHHAHALLHSGRQVIEEFFPGITAELIAQGAPLGRGRLFTAGGYLCRNPRTPESLFVSRPRLEREVRRQVRRLPNVKIVEGTEVDGLAADAVGSRVTGVNLRRRHPQKAEPLASDLVVDATGRGSRAGTWLEALGYAAPEVERVEVGMGYSSRFYRRRPGDLNGDLIVNVAPSPDHLRAGAAVAQEGERWLITLAGYFGDYPPADQEGFLEFARSLPVAEIHAIARSAEPLSEPVTYRFRANQRRRYEKLHRFPEGFLVIGDALCSFTPIYGQGMSVAALEARALSDCLADGSDHLARRYFQRAAKPVDLAWTITVGNDRRLSGDPASPKFPANLLNWYLLELQVAARRDPELTLAFTRVANLLAAPPTLLHPRIAWRVLWGLLHRSEEYRVSTSPPEPELDSGASRRW